MAGSVGVVKYSKEGQFRWVHCERFSTPRVRTLPNGNGAYVLGLTPGPESDLRVARLTADGDTMWSQNLYFGPYVTDVDLVGKALEVDAQQNLCIAVTSKVAGAPRSEDVEVAKLDLDGNSLWIRRFGELGREETVSDIAACPDGSIAVAVYAWTAAGEPQTSSDTSGFDMVVLKYSGAGDLLWSRSYGPVPGVRDMPTSLATDSGGNIYTAVLSSTDSSPNTVPRRASILKYDAEGTLLWKTHWTALPGWKLAVDAAGDLYATGAKEFNLHLSNIDHNEFGVIKFGQSYPRLVSCTGLTDGVFHGVLVSDRGSEFEVFKSETMPSGEWQRVVAVTNQTGLAPFDDPQAGDSNTRFYQAVEVAP